MRLPTSCFLLAIVTVSAATACGEDDAPPPAEPSTSATPVATDGGGDLTLPPQLATCVSCFEETCKPEASTCADDPTCVDLLVCTAKTGCLQTGGEPTACVLACGEELGLDRAEVTKQAAKLASIATVCGSCVKACVPADAGRD